MDVDDAEIESATSSMQTMRSTTELIAHGLNGRTTLGRAMQHRHN